MRAFFAVDLDADARRAAAALAERLREAARDARWVRPESYHVTLRFLGEVAPERVGELAARAGEAVAPVAAFRLRLGAARAFPSPQRPRVVAVELAPEAPLAELAARLEDVAVAAGWPAETRPFRSHLTLARATRGGRLRVPGLVAAPDPGAGAGAGEMGEAGESDSCEFGVDEVVLFESELRPSGARYTAHARLPLASDFPNTPSKGESSGQE